MPLLRVVDSTIKRTLRDANHLRANTDAAFIQGFDCYLVAFSDFTKHVFFFDLAIFENQFTSRAGAYAKLVFFLANRESREFALDYESGDPAIALLRSCVREHDEDAGFRAVGDPQLATVEYE